MIQKVKMQCDNCGAPLSQQTSIVWKCEHCDVPYIVTDNSPAPARPRPTVSFSTCTYYSGDTISTYESVGMRSVLGLNGDDIKRLLPRIDWM